MRLIDADAFKKYIADGFDGLILPKGQAEKAIEITKGFLKDIDEQPTIKTFTLADIEEQYRKGLEKGLEESREEKEHIISWLSKFCLHIDMADKHLSDAEALEFWKKKMNQQFGWGEGEEE